MRAICRSARGRLSDGKCCRSPVRAAHRSSPTSSNYVAATTCDASIYSNYITKFEGAGMGWTSWAWIVDEWGCAFPQIIADYSGTPNAIGTPVKNSLTSLNP
jgi:hypothetical protein